MGPLFTEPHFKASQHSEIGKTNAAYLGDMLTEGISWAYVRTMIKPSWISIREIAQPKTHCPPVSMYGVSLTLLMTHQQVYSLSSMVELKLLDPQQGFYSRS